MAQRASVNLSDLPGGDHLVKDNSNQGTCVVYMKLTEACVKAIDALLAAKKGANDCGLCVNFNPSGGTFTVPGDALSEAKSFEFQTNKIEKGSVECLHQHRLIQGSKQTGQTLSNLGNIQHKLSIKATDDVYETTKTKALEAEEERKESHRVKQIEKLPSKRTPLKIKPRPTEVPNSHQLKIPPKKQEELMTSNSANMRIIRDRVIHFLALKAHRKVDLHNRLKKDKHCENSLSYLDQVLQQVAEQAPHDRAVYNLKPSYYSELKVDTFPKYSDQERVIVRRNLLEAGIKVPSSGLKRAAASEDSPNITKRAKSHSTMKHTKPIDTSTTTSIINTNSICTTATTTTVPRALDNDTLPKNPTTETIINDDPTKKVPSTDVTPQVDQKKHKKKKKHKKDTKEETAEIPKVVAPQEPSPSAPVEDDLSRFTAITSHEQRARYKEEFNAGYSRYTELKNKIDQVTVEFNELRNQLHSCPKSSDEYKRLSHSIRKKYKEKQSDEAYKQEKQEYQLLSTKLNHIKKLVIEYDNFIVEHNS